MPRPAAICAASPRPVAHVPQCRERLNPHCSASGRLLQVSDHPNVVDLHEIWEDSSYIFIVMVGASLLWWVLSIVMAGASA